jgi:hypothetical protein
MTIAANPTARTHGADENTPAFVPGGSAGPWDRTRGQDPITFRETVSDSREIAVRALEASRVDAESIEHTMRHVDGDITDARMANYVRAVSDPEYKTAFLKVLRPVARRNRMDPRGTGRVPVRHARPACDVGRLRRDRSLRGPANA